MQVSGEELDSCFRGTPYSPVLGFISRGHYRYNPFIHPSLVPLGIVYRSCSVTVYIHLDISIFIDPWGTRLSSEASRRDTESDFLAKYDFSRVIDTRRTTTTWIHRGVVNRRADGRRDAMPVAKRQ